MPGVTLKEQILKSPDLYSGHLGRIRWISPDGEIVEPAGSIYEDKPFVDTDKGGKVEKLLAVEPNAPGKKPDDIAVAVVASDEKGTAKLIIDAAHEDRRATPKDVSPALLAGVVKLGLERVGRNIGILSATSSVDLSLVEAAGFRESEDGTHIFENNGGRVTVIPPHPQEVW